MSEPLRHVETTIKAVAADGRTYHLEAEGWSTIEGVRARVGAFLGEIETDQAIPAPTGLGLCESTRACRADIHYSACPNWDGYRPIGGAFNACRKCGHPVPSPFSAHVDALGGCPEIVERA